MINSEELLFVVDENNNPIQAQSRKETHAKKLWHRTSQIWILNSQNQILCQKRSLIKDANPGRWEAHFGGHIRSGEDYIDNAITETKEEVGLNRNKADMIFFKTFKYEKDREFQGIFYTRWDGDISDLMLEEEEVDEVKFINLSKLQKIFRDRNIAWVHKGYEQELLDLLGR